MNRLLPGVIALCAAFVSDGDPRLTVSLTHVCRCWRRKAITSSPRNWGWIGSKWKRLVPLCLERAGVVPLDVDITVSDIKDDEIFLNAFLPHISKIAYLSLSGYSSIQDVADNLPGFFASPMLDLISLELEQDEEPTESFPSSEIPTHPLFQNVSKLKSLYLTRTPLYPALANITSLTELKLVGYTTPFHFGKFIRFLRSNPDLELITLDIQFVEAPAWVRPARIVSFARLR